MHKQTKRLPTPPQGEVVSVSPPAPTVKQLQSVPPLQLTPIKPRAMDLCQQFGISLRCAYHHIKAGTIPTGQRRKGQDGKSYPIRKRDSDLKKAWLALNRAREHKTGDVELLTRIYGLASAMLQEVA